jgi:Domain of unknown function (DUF4396)
MVPLWLHWLSIASVALGFACAAVLALDVARHPQHMWIMNLVWPIVALFGTGLALWGYFAYGRAATPERTPAGSVPFAVMVGKAASHCGSGCTVGDVCAEWLAFACPAVAVWFGWHRIFADKMFAVWVLDYLFALAFGIVFQYFAIAPMRGLGLVEGLWQAAKADALSLTAWQVGMYGFMALAELYLFRRLLGVELDVDSFPYWFMMQIAMLCGFATAYPVNGWLIRTGIKEAM